MILPSKEEKDLRALDISEDDRQLASESLGAWALLPLWKAGTQDA